MWISAVLIASALALWILSVALRIAAGGIRKTNRDADAAIILGAAVDDKGMVSDVFRERLKHGIQMYHNKRVRMILITGGVGDGKDVSEAAVGRQFAIKAGVPPDKILTEDASRTTFQNLYFAREIMLQNSLKTALIVSDPTHMARAMMMCSYIGITAYPAPRPVNATLAGDAVRGRSVIREMVSYLGFVIGCLFFLPEENPNRF